MPGNIDVVGIGRGWNQPTEADSTKETAEMLAKADSVCTGPWCYVAAVVAAAAAFALRYVLLGPDEPRFPYLLTLPVVVAVAGVLGLGPGLVATLVGGLLPAFFLLEPLRDLRVVGRIDATGLGIYFVSAIGMTLGVRALVREKLGRLSAAMAQRRLVNEAAVLKFELRHRTKNELQQIVAMFHLQARVATTDGERQALKAMGHRVQAIGTIHDMLLESTQHPDDPVDTGVFLTGIVRKLRDASADMPVDWQVVVESHRLSHIIAIPLGLMVNELAGNAIKHGYPAGRSGRIMVSFRRDRAEYVLEVVDDGVGVGSTAPPRPGIGQRVMRGLAANLGASSPVCQRLSDDGGTHCIVRFPVARTTSTLRPELAA